MRTPIKSKICSEVSENKRPCKNLQGFKVRNFLRKRKILGSEMRTQAFALHSPYEFFQLRAEQKKRISTFIEIHKIQFFLRGE